MQIVSIRYLIILGVTLLSLLSCSKSFDNIEGYEAYIYDNDYYGYQEIVKNDFKFTLRYMPTDAMMINEYKAIITEEKKISHNESLSDSVRACIISESKNELLDAQKAFDKSIYFILTIGFEDRKEDIIFSSLNNGRYNYDYWLNRLLFSMKDYIFLKSTSTGKIPMSLYNMDRTFGMTKSRSFLLSFPKRFNEKELKKITDLSLVIEEFGLHIGRVNFDKLVLNNKIKLDF